MRLKSFRVQNYRSIIDSGEVEVEDAKTILVGPNEAGKSAILKALQQINPPNGTKKLDALRDYPRRLYNDIDTGKVIPSDIKIVSAKFAFEDEERTHFPSEWGKVHYNCTKFLDGSFKHSISGGPVAPTFGDVKAECDELSNLADEQAIDNGGDESQFFNSKLKALNLSENSILAGKTGKALAEWLDELSTHVYPQDCEMRRSLDKVKAMIQDALDYEQATKTARIFLPVFIYYNNYLRVRPVLHLKNLADRLRSNNLDDDQYDYGNIRMLNLLGFNVDELSRLGDGSNSDANSVSEFDDFRSKLDKRRYALDAAEVKLTEGVTEVWNPDRSKGETARLRIDVDGQYLKVSVVDDLGVSVELDQRSEGLQWLISFFIIFFAEAQDKHKNAILLLDEPGLSLHGLKQQEFRKTIDRISATSQTLFTTHSPFMVGPDELDRVRVVEMENRTVGTKVHKTVAAKDSAALLPLQEALGYDLAQSLFTQKRNLILEGITDYFYLDATAQLLQESNIAKLDSKVALIPAGGAGKVVYFATILHAQNLKVAALFDSDSAGDAAASQDSLVDILSDKRILRTKDFGPSDVNYCQIEDLLRSTLVCLVKSEYDIDIQEQTEKQRQRSIIEIVREKKLSKYELAKSYLKWSRNHTAENLTEQERKNWTLLIKHVNKILK